MRARAAQIHGTRMAPSPGTPTPRRRATPTRALGSRSGTPGSASSSRWCPRRKTHASRSCRRDNACVVRIESGSQGFELDSAGCCGRPQQQERGPAGPPRCPRSVPRPRPGRPSTCCGAAQWPMNGGTGNHEEEQQADGSAFRSLRARWPVRPALAKYAAGRAAGADQGSAQCAAGSTRCQGVAGGNAPRAGRAQSAEHRARCACCRMMTG